MADEEELLRQAEVLAAVGQEERDGDGEPHRHGGNGRADLEDLGGLRYELLVPFEIDIQGGPTEIYSGKSFFIKVNR